VQLPRPKGENRATREPPLDPSSLPLSATNAGAEGGQTTQADSPHSGRKEESAFKPYPVRAVEGVRAGVFFF